jgi:hypothetical protein
MQGAPERACLRDMQHAAAAHDAAALRVCAHCQARPGQARPGQARPGQVRAALTRCRPPHPIPPGSARGWASPASSTRSRCPEGSAGHIRCSSQAAGLVCKCSHVPPRAAHAAPCAPCLPAKEQGASAKRPSTPLAGSSCSPAQQPSSPAAQQPSSPAAQQPSSPAAQQPSSPAAPTHLLVLGKVVSHVDASSDGAAQVDLGLHLQGGKGQQGSDAGAAGAAGSVTAACMPSCAASSGSEALPAADPQPRAEHCASAAARPQARRSAARTLSCTVSLAPRRSRLGSPPMESYLRRAAAPAGPERSNAVDLRSSAPIALAPAPSHAVHTARGRDRSALPQQQQQHAQGRVGLKLAAAAAHSDRVHLVYFLTGLQVPGVKGLGGTPACAKVRAAS